MGLPNDSILVTPGTGATVATHLVSGKEYQVIMEADIAGHIKGSREDWLAYYTPVTNAANRSVADLFNAHATAILRVQGIWVIPSLTTITGVQIGFNLNRISAAGTGGTTVTPRPLDTTFSALPAGITAMYGSTGGDTLVYTYSTCFFYNDETSPSAGVVALFNQLPVLGDKVVEIVLRQNQGIQIKQAVTATVGLTGALIYFTVE